MSLCRSRQPQFFLSANCLPHTSHIALKLLQASYSLILPFPYFIRFERTSLWSSVGSTFSVPSTLTMAFVNTLRVGSNSLFGHMLKSYDRKHRCQRTYTGRRHIAASKFAKRRSTICCASQMSDADRRQQLLDVLSAIEDPDLHRNIVSLGFVKDVVFEEVSQNPHLFDVKFKVELTTPACPVKEVFHSDCKRLAENIEWIRNASITMTATPPDANTATSTGALDHVGAIIAVASCKGGVGKSTTAVNLAFALSSQGARVGIMDADIYGPSLPTLVEPDDRAVQFASGRIQPLTCKGVKLMSFGYINPESAIMRGPMIANVLNQLVTTTQWGSLDYLILDMPPGTGDVQLTLSQIVNMSAAVIVTTPQKLSFVDVVKGIDMFDKVSVPSIAVVENMSYFIPPESGKKHYIFGHGHRTKLVEQYGLKNSFEMPIEAELSELSDSGLPYVLARPDSLVAKEYHNMAECVVREVAKIKHSGLGIPDVEFKEESGYIHIKKSRHSETRVWPAALRRQCRCALCIDEMTGKVILDPATVDEDVKPTNIRRVGNYAVEVAWSDSHFSLYPYARFVDGWESTAPSKDSFEKPQPKDAELSVPS